MVLKWCWDEELDHSEGTLLRDGEIFWCSSRCEWSRNVTEQRRRNKESKSLDWRMRTERSRRESKDERKEKFWGFYERGKWGRGEGGRVISERKRLISETLKPICHSDNGVGIKWKLHLRMEAKRWGEAKRRKGKGFRRRTTEGETKKQNLVTVRSQQTAA